MISIIIPTLNEEKILEKTLTRLKALKSVDYEIIVSDGASTDRTLEIARKHAHKVVEHDGKSRQTIGIGRNQGAAAAAGDFVVFLDADVSVPDMDNFFTTALKLFQADPKLKGLTVFVKVLPEHATLADKFFFGLGNRYHQLLNNVFRGGSASGEFMMVRKEAFDEVGGFNPKVVMGEDQELFSQLSKKGRTRVASHLHVMHTGRRVHKTGWPKMLMIWWGNLLYAKIFKKSIIKEWKVIR